MKTSHPTARFLALLAVGLAFAGSLPAATLTWDAAVTNNAQSGPWDFKGTANWNNGSTPDVQWTSGAATGADTAVFGVAGATSGTVTVSTTNGAVYVGGMTFNQSSYMISGSTLTLSPATTGGTVVIDTTTTGTTTISSVLAGPSSVTKNGTGTLSLGAVNTFNGGITLSGGTLQIAFGSSLGAATTSTPQIAFTGTSTLLIGNNNLVAGRPLAISSAVTATIDTGSSTGSGVTGVISGAGNLVKAGTGTLVLGGANTYAGTTTVNAGTLLVNNSTASSSAVTVSGGTLGGIGMVGGTVTVNSGGTMQAGGVTSATNPSYSAIGKLTTGALTLSSGSIFNALVNASGTAGTNYSQLLAGGTTSLSGASFAVTLNGTPSLAVGNVLTLIGTSISGTFTNSTYTTGGYTFAADYTDNSGLFDVKVTATPVPEPATWLAGGMIVLVSMGTFRRRLRTA